MSQPQYTPERRSFLKSMVAGGGAVLACSPSAFSDDIALRLAVEHHRALNRRPRIVVQCDCGGDATQLTVTNPHSWRR
jgi:hypothetical protein